MLFAGVDYLLGKSIIEEDFEISKLVKEYITMQWEEHTSARLFLKKHWPLVLEHT